MEAEAIFEKFSSATNQQVNVKEYQAAIGLLICASIGTRLDISYAVGILSQFMSKTGEKHWQSIKGILRYIKGILSHCLEFVSTKGNKVDLSAYADADWAGDRATRKSTSDYAFIIGNLCITWRSKHQSIIALSSIEAEYVPHSHATQKAVWLRELLKNIGFKQTEPTKLYEDNQCAIGLSKNLKPNSRTKHIEIKFHYARKAVEDNIVDVQYCPTEQMIADIFTESLARVEFEKFRDMLGVKK